MYQDLFYETLEMCKRAIPAKRKFHFKNKLLSLDSTIISLCLTLFPWAEFRRTKEAVKQNLKIKTFVGTSKNTLYTQIWTALIAILLIKYLQFKSKMKWSLSNLVAFLWWNLFIHREMEKLLSF